jgi:DNA (cytosine-5)-methyltransferase 1
MHRQIGNAVPLPIGHALGWELKEALFENHKSNLAQVIEIIDKHVQN